MNLPFAKLPINVDLLQVHTNGTPADVQVRLHITQCLCHFEGGKGDILPGHFEIGGGVFGDVEQEDVVLTAFVQLAGGMLEPRPKTEGDGTAGLLRDRFAQVFHLRGGGIVTRQIGVDGDILTLFRHRNILAYQGIQVFCT